MGPVTQAQEGLNKYKQRHPQIEGNCECGDNHNISAQAEEIFYEGGHKSE